MHRSGESVSRAATPFIEMNSPFINIIYIARPSSSSVVNSVGGDDEKARTRPSIRLMGMGGIHLHLNFRLLRAGCVHRDT